MPDFGPYTASGYAQVTTGVSGEQPWAGSETSVNAVDGTYLEAQPWIANPPAPDPSTEMVAGNTKYADFTDFGAAVPAGYVVTGILLEVQRKQDSPRAAGTNIRDRNVQILSGGANLAKLATNWPNAVGLATYGPALDATGWDLAGEITAEMVNDPSFGFRIAAMANGGPVALPLVGDDVPYGRIDLVQVTYTAIPALQGGPGTFTIIPDFAYKVND